MLPAGLQAGKRARVPYLHQEHIGFIGGVCKPKMLRYIAEPAHKVESDFFFAKLLKHAFGFTFESVSDILC